MPNVDTYHLTPCSLVGETFAPDSFGDIQIALMGFCPPPKALAKYSPESSLDQHFIHVSPASVQILHQGPARILSLVHIYGGPVASATVEELAHYGIRYILAYGLAGGLGTKALGMGDFYLVESAFAADGTTPHYSGEAIGFPDSELQECVLGLWKSGPRDTMTSVRAATGDAVYREDNAMLSDFRRNHCDIVNLDSSHLYAASRNNSENRAIKTVQCGVISDIISAQKNISAENTLSEMLSDDADNPLNPLDRAGEIVSFYVEQLAPALSVT